MKLRNVKSKLCFILLLLMLSNINKLKQLYIVFLSIDFFFYLILFLEKYYICNTRNTLKNFIAAINLYRLFSTVHINNSEKFRNAQNFTFKKTHLN